MFRLAPRLMLLLLSASIVLTSSLGRAQSKQRETDASRMILGVVSPARWTTDRYLRLCGAVRAQLGELDVTLVCGNLRSGAVQSTVRMEEGDSGSIRLSYANEDGAPVLLRVLSGAQAGDDESIAIIVRHVVLAVLDGRPLPVEPIGDAKAGKAPDSTQPADDAIATRPIDIAESATIPEAEEPSPAVRPAASPRPARRPPSASPEAEPVADPPITSSLRLSAAYAGTSIADELPWQHGVTAGIAYFPDGAGGGVDLSLAAFPPANVEAGRVSLRLGRYEVAGGGGFEIRPGRFRLGAGAALTVEVATRETSDVSASLAALDPATSVSLGVRPRATAAFAPWGPLSFHVSGGLGAIFNPPAYVVEEGNRNAPLLETYALRARLEAGLAIELDAAPAAASGQVSAHRAGRKK